MLSFNILTIFALLLFVSCGLASKKEESCPLARDTAEIVSSCPRTNEEWEKAAARKNCENLTQPCPNYIYHCVINAWMNATVEVCAPRKVIVGNVCAEFNFGGDTIQRNSKAHCKKCPNVYTSSIAFRYPECYEYVNKSKEISKANNWSSHAESNISIVIGVSVPTAALIILLVILIFRRIGRGPTSNGRPTEDACTSIPRMLSSYCIPKKQATSEADSLADQNGSVDTQRNTLTEETRLQPLIDHANV